MIRDSIGLDLEVAIIFQKFYIEAACMTLEAKFEDDNVIDTFKVYNPIHRLHMQIGFVS